MIMDVLECDLKKVRDMCLEFYGDEETNIISIILYGGAAKNYVGQEHDPGDFDLNVFLSAQAAIPSTYGMPQKIGEHDGVTVEVMRNKIPEETTVQEYVAAQDSKRWDRITEEPIIQLYPSIQRLDLG